MQCMNLGRNICCSILLGLMKPCLNCKGKYMRNKKLGQSTLIFFLYKYGNDTNLIRVAWYNDYRKFISFMTDQ